MANPFQALLRSRKFWLAVWALIQTIVMTFLDVPAEIIAAADAVVMVLIGAIAVEDAAQKMRS